MSIPSTTPDTPIDVLIVGGGLSGLVVAWLLSQISPSTGECRSENRTERRSPRWHLFEAQDQLGGRLQNDPLGFEIDMGGAWVWPEYQPQMRSLLSELNLNDTIQQPEESMNDGRVRIKGGAGKIITSLESLLDPHQLTLSARVLSCSRLKEKRDVMKVELIMHGSARDAGRHTIYAKQMVWTAPPRMSMAPTIHWDPPVSKSKTEEQSRSNTWMASVTKVSFIYDEKLWDEEWLKGLKINLYRSRHNSEVFDVYDACTLPSSHSTATKHRDGDDCDAGTKGVAAFTVFALLSYNNDQNSLQASDIATRIMSQLISIAPLSKSASPKTDDAATFSSWMANYSHTVVKQWPRVDSISDDPNPQMVGRHPQPKSALAMAEWPIYSGNDEIGRILHFAGTESDLRSPGLMEGAVGAARRAVNELKQGWGLSGI